MAMGSDKGSSSSSSSSSFIVVLSLLFLFLSSLRLLSLALSVFEPPFFFLSAAFAPSFLRPGFDSRVGSFASSAKSFFPSSSIPPSVSMTLFADCNKQNTTSVSNCPYVRK